MSLKLNERYPGRFTNPSADYPLGSFKNRTSPTAKDGSYLEKDWANDKEGFFQSLLSAVGLAANGLVDRVGASQAFDALLRIGQGQNGKAFSTGGAAPALTLTPSPSVSAYALGLRFQVTFSAAGGATPTLNISGLGAKSLMQYSSAGAKVAANTVAGQVADVVFDGTDLVIVNPVNTIPQATSSVIGVSRFATQTEVNNSAATNLAVAPATLGVLLTAYVKQATTAVAGIARIATQAEVNNAFAPDLIVTPSTFGVALTGYFSANALGNSQTWQDLTSNRSANTTYTNSAGRPIAVSIYTASATNWIASITVSGVIVASNTTNNMTSGGVGTLNAIIPPGASYSFALSATSISKWMELR